MRQSEALETTNLSASAPAGASRYARLRAVFPPCGAVWPCTNTAVGCRSRWGGCRPVAPFFFPPRRLGGFQRGGSLALPLWFLYNQLMAKVEYIDMLPGLESAYFSGIRFGDRFVSSRVAKKFVFYSRKRKKGLSAKSMLPVISELWAGLSDEEKTAWSEAGAESDLNGWRLFVQDTSARIVNEIAGVATPSLFHQSWVGNLKIEAPATELKIVQLHPHYYFVSQKVQGKKGMYKPVPVTESLSLPLTISLNYSSDLTSQGAGAFAKLYARFWYSYQGVDRYYDLEIPLDFSTNWKNATATITTLTSYVIRYDLYFHLYNLRGDLYFDNIKVEHSGQNWVRDTFCKDILQGFTRAFYQIPDHWAGVILPDGAYFDSIYKDF